MNDKYEEFLRRKEITAPSAGIDIENVTISDKLFDFQRDIVLWALKKGKAAIFAGTGLGKTLMQLEWASHIGGTVLILAPLAASKQTISEGGEVRDHRPPLPLAGRCHRWRDQHHEL